MLLKIELWQMFFRNLIKYSPRKLSPYFTELQKTVGKLGSSVENPNVVLSPGAGNETYFEHVYLSSHLGSSRRK
jgi:uncharacterized circularly permuted ATP-grasp superfamily protein